jgi:hypothetical protein
MARIKLPPQNIPFLLPSGLVDPDWYDVLRQLDDLDPLSNVVFPTSVSSIDTATGDITIGNGLTRSLQQISASLSRVSASLAADVALGAAGTYNDGPSISLGSVGTWFVSGTATVTDTSSAANHDAKLWDGTTIIASCSFTTLNTGRNIAVLSGFITNPAGNVRISVRDLTSGNGKILFNQSGNSKDSTISAVRIA